MQKIKPQDYDFYELLSGGSFHFSTYHTPDGTLKGVKERIDPKTGEPIHKRFTLTRESMARVHRGNKAEVEFFENHPNNPDSPYFNGRAVFRKYQPEKAAEFEVDLELKKANAITEAGNLKGERLFEIAALLGMHFEQSEEKTALREVVKYAASDPIAFIKIIKTPQKESRALRVLRAGQSAGVIKSRDGAWKFGDTLLGVDEDGAVARLIGDADLMEIITRRVGLAKEQDEEVKTRVGKPKAVAAE